MDGFNFQREVFLPTNATNDNENEIENEPCNYNNVCCSRDQCEYSIHDQVKYFINMRNLYR